MTQIRKESAKPCEASPRIVSRHSLLRVLAEPLRGGDDAAGAVSSVFPSGNCVSRVHPSGGTSARGSPEKLASSSRGGQARPVSSSLKQRQLQDDEDWGMGE